MLSTLHATGCRISEALARTARQIDLSGRAWYSKV
jgi:site-specific recombinase XerD